MQRYQDETARFDFGDDDNSIWWEAVVSLDVEYKEIVSHYVTSVRVDGKKIKFDQVDSDLQARIEKRMMALEYSEV